MRRNQVAVVGAAETTELGVIPNMSQIQLHADAALNAIGQAAAAGDEINLPGFGKFKVKETPEREGRNPATGATIKIAASKKLTFTPGKAVKDALNG